jgi:predicted lipid-binding transport protein (Tim44 family)
MSSLTNPAPQFSTAEFQGGPDRCQICGQTLGSTYYRVGTNQSCPACAEKAKFEAPKDTHAAFVRGLMFGIGGAILGLIAYSTFTIITGIIIGYLSLLVGWLVAKGIMKGSSGIGGRRYQITAVLLTYAAVSMSAIPIGISFYVKEQSAKKSHLVQHATGSPSKSAASEDAPNEESAAPGSASGQNATARTSFGAALGSLLLAGLASPFLAMQDPFHGLIGLVILAVGIRIAWQNTAGKPVNILGPFNRSAAPPPMG